MTPAREHPHLPATVRFYRWTTIYICFALAVILGLLIWDRLDGPEPSVCTMPTAITQGETR